MPEVEPNFAVWLTRIEGKLDLSSMRHEQTDTWKLTVDQRLYRHSNDISSLQSKALFSEGRRQGFLTGGRILWAGIGTICGGGGIAALMKLFGA